MTYTSEAKDKDWYYKSVIELLNGGGVVAYTDGTITFSELLKMIMNSVTGKECPTEKGDYWASGVLEEAVKLRIIGVQEFPGTTAVLNKDITREDMTLIFLNINLEIHGEEKVDTCKKSVKIKVIDKINPKIKGYVLQADKKTLITGKPGGFNPKRVATRANVKCYRFS